jgi:hypothetical protein
MTALLLIITFAAVLAVFGSLATVFGADSRETAGPGLE